VGVVDTNVHAHAAEVVTDMDTSAGLCVGTCRACPRTDVRVK